jgi:hypothetical protein
VRYAPDSSGRLVIESKDAMKARRLRSPDLADALGLTFAPAVAEVPVVAPLLSTQPSCWGSWRSWHS